MDADEFREAIRSDDPREALTALRDRLADGVLAADDNRLLHLAPIAKQLVEVLEKIQAIPEAEGDSVDDSRDAAERILRSVG